MHKTRQDKAGRDEESKGKYVMFAADDVNGMMRGGVGCGYVGKRSLHSSVVATFLGVARDLLHDVIFAVQCAFTECLSVSICTKDYRLGQIYE